MIDRDALIHQFLQGTHWENWQRSALAGDASSRRYVRLINDQQSAILMDADPATGQSTLTFTTIGNWLIDNNLCAPRTLLHDPDKGLLLLEDLGPVDFAIHLKSNPDDATTLYRSATDILITLDRADAPPFLSRMTPDIAGEMLDITPEWYGDTAQSRIGVEMAEHMARLCPDANTVALRDFHAENLIWRADKKGSDRVGLLDYQDAFIAPRGYDLVSMLRDVRRVVDPDLADAMIAHFISETGEYPSQFPAALACLGAQRNLRILGVFARLALRDGKTRYVAMIPHVWAMIKADLAHPALDNLRKCVEQTLPSPEKSTIRDLL